MIITIQTALGETVAERLGYKADDVLLIIHADDMGMCRSANQACMECLDKGIVTSASVMVPCPWFPQAAQYFRENPEADMGLHLTLTAEWKKYRWGPVASKSEVPGLIDLEGYLF
ncbi:ChbG/HpnK family deacetylase, partial [bacterium]|nr:ChbG/HpnK family deacetylase [bacterium]